MKKLPESLLTSVLRQGLTTLFCKGPELVNILDFAGHTVSMETLLLCSAEAAIDDT